jgi:hypothetical protein
MHIHAIPRTKLKLQKHSFVLTVYENEKFNFHGDSHIGDAAIIYQVFIAA